MTDEQSSSSSATNLGVEETHNTNLRRGPSNSAADAVGAQATLQESASPFAGLEDCMTVVEGNHTSGEAVLES